uniref:Uncharacterized protein n=1 Tax=Anguilla anguilla TaxID=7936 RepID=A0A0E9X6S2_ANGAN
MRESVKEKDKDNVTKGRLFVCVCVSVCDREREREIERDKECSTRKSRTSLATCPSAVRCQCFFQFSLLCKMSKNVSP